ncbi:MAG: hypothetical protein LBD64_03315 [Odoribacteraceae bacterium]|nr:hypothetical protein [Odoribacteraceae bacterium]
MKRPPGMETLLLLAGRFPAGGSVFPLSHARPATRPVEVGVSRELVSLPWERGGRGIFTIFINTYEHE